MVTKLTFFQDGTDLLAVAIHEIGHNLGLDHSNVGNSIMYPFIQNNINGLHDDDINGIQKLYGVPDTHTQGLFTIIHNYKIILAYYIKYVNISDIASLIQSLK